MLGWGLLVAGSGRGQEASARAPCALEEQPEDVQRAGPCLLGPGPLGSFQAGDTAVVTLCALTVRPPLPPYSHQHLL